MLWAGRKPNEETRKCRIIGNSLMSVPSSQSVGDEISDSYTHEKSIYHVFDIVSLNNQDWRFIFFRNIKNLYPTDFGLASSIFLRHLVATCRFIMLFNIINIIDDIGSSRCLLINEYQAALRGRRLKVLIRTWRIHRFKEFGVWSKFWLSLPTIHFHTYVRVLPLLLEGLLAWKKVQWGQSLDG